MSLVAQRTRANEVRPGQYVSDLTGNRSKVESIREMEMDHNGSQEIVLLFTLNDGRMVRLPYEHVLVVGDDD